MLDVLPSGITEPEAYAFPVNLQGAGAAVPTRLKGRNNYGISRSGVGAIKLTFNDDPGPTFLGLGGFAFGDPTAANVLGWSVVSQVYTPPAGSALASLTLTIGNGANAAADLLATSTLTLDLRFKRAATDL